LKQGLLVDTLVEDEEIVVIVLEILNKIAHNHVCMKHVIITFRINIIAH